MIESTLDLTGVDRGEFLIRADFDECLSSKVSTDSDLIQECQINNFSDKFLRCTEEDCCLGKRNRERIRQSKISFINVLLLLIFVLLFICYLS